MLVLVLGLILFLGIHSARIVAPEGRMAFIEGRGEGAWKGLYTLASIVGLALLVWGYALYRGEADQAYVPPDWGRTLQLLLMPVALTLVVASQMPQGYIRRAVQHPMLWGVMLWAVLHLLGNGDWASVLLFGAFLVWAVADLVSCYRRPRANPHAAGAAAATAWWPDVAAIVVGLALTVAFVSFLHEWLFGVAIVA